MSEFLEKVNAELVECQGKLKENMSEESKAAQELRGAATSLSKKGVDVVWLESRIESVLAELAAWSEAFGTNDVKVAANEFDQAHRELSTVTAERNTLKAALEECRECCGDEHKKGYVPVSELEPTIELLAMLSQYQAYPMYRMRVGEELSRLEKLKGGEGE